MTKSTGKKIINSRVSVYILLKDLLYASEHVWQANLIFFFDTLCVSEGLMIICLKETHGVLLAKFAKQMRAESVVREMA